MVIIFIYLFLFSLIYAEDENFKWRELQNNAFSVNEKMEYIVKLGIITLGDATMEVKEIDTCADRKSYHLISTINSNSFCDKFYRTRTWEESWMDVVSLCSHKYIKHNRENEKSEDKTTLFDHINRKFSYVEINTIDNSIKKEATGDIPEFINDTLSSVYFIRTLPLKECSEFYFSTQSEDRNYMLKVVIHKKEKIKVPAGEFSCLMVEPLPATDDKELLSKGRMVMWLTNDNKKIPVMIKTQIQIGSILMLLKNIRQ